jgi:DNA polymerase III epsilon subunit-like protein
MAAPTNKLILCFDTETTGLPNRPQKFNTFYSPEQTHHYDSARIVQIAWQLFAADGTAAAPPVMYYLRPDGWTISLANQQIHGITQEICFSDGRNFSDVGVEFLADLGRSTMVIGHNTKFDVHIVASEFYRIGHHLAASQVMFKKQGCTMALGRQLAPFKSKYPKLIDLYKHLFGQEFEKSHTATADMQAAAMIWFKLAGAAVTSTRDSRQIRPAGGLPGASAPRAKIESRPLSLEYTLPPTITMSDKQAALVDSIKVGVASMITPELKKIAEEGAKNSVALAAIIARLDLLESMLAGGVAAPPPKRAVRAAAGPAAAAGKPASAKGCAAKKGSATPSITNAMLWFRVAMRDNLDSVRDRWGTEDNIRQAMEDLADTAVSKKDRVKDEAGFFTTFGQYVWKNILETPEKEEVRQLFNAYKEALTREGAEPQLEEEVDVE